MRKGGVPLRVAVAGGSIGGLCAGIALRAIGCEVAVYERTPGAMTSRGAGIAVQSDLLDLLRRHGAPALPLTSCRQRRYLVPDGGDGRTVPLPQRFSSWHAIYQTLRSAFPAERYHQGWALTGFEQRQGRVAAQFSQRDAVEADLLVCSDGTYSETRRRLLPDIEPRYAGYIAWRGMVDEDRLPARLVRFFDDCFTLCAARSSGHILSYFIPGAGAATETGRRRLNWVWYVNVPGGAALERLLVDRTGARHDASVPAGMVPDDLKAEIQALAAQEVHPCFAELVQATAEPFIQVIRDVAVPRMVFGRACLLGDAAFVLRPHPAAASAKAAADAADLAASLAAHPDPDAALRAWETQRLEQGHALLALAVAQGRRSVDPRDHPPTLADAPERFHAISLGRPQPG
jgi:2-polyprenyl-6-methoxyphenol hydroxylase-like FAD-dependent oxidoreductase